MSEQEFDDAGGQPEQQPRNNVPAVRQPMPPAADPFARMREAGAVNAGAIAIETERAIAEAQGQLTLAKKFPRPMTKAYNDFMDACSRPGFAQAAFYSVPRAGSKVTGPSIRFAEEAARCFGNFQYGHRELGRADGKSEIEVYAWDMENNNYSKRQITVLHVLDTRDGQRPLRDQRDIDDRIANVASKQMRGRILALLPKYMVEDGIAKCRATLAGNVDLPIPERVRRMAGAFGQFGVTTAHLEAYLEHSVDLCTLDELINLTGVYNAIKNDGRKPSEYFDMVGAGGQPTQVANAAQAAAIAQAAAAGRQQQAAPAATGQGEAAAPPAGTQAPRPTATQPPRQQAQTPAQGAQQATPRGTRAPTPRSTSAPAAPPAEHPQAPAAEQPSGPPPGAADDDVF